MMPNEEAEAHFATILSGISAFFSGKARIIVTPVGDEPASLKLGDAAIAYRGSFAVTFNKEG